MPSTSDTKSSTCVYVVDGLEVYRDTREFPGMGPLRVDFTVQERIPNHPTGDTRPVKKSIIMHWDHMTQAGEHVYRGWEIP